MAIDSKYAKGYYRRAKAHISMGNHLEGARDFTRIMKIEPENLQVQAELDSMVAKHLSDKDKQLLVKESREVSASQSSASVQGGQYRRIAIVEEDDDDEDEEKTEDNPKKAEVKKNQGSAIGAGVAGSKDVQMTVTKQTNTTDKTPVSQTKDNGKDRSVFIKELKKRQDLKADAVVEIKKAMFEVAIKMMSKELDYFDEDEVRLAGLNYELSVEYYTLKMSYHANLALCYAQIDQPNKVIEYCDVVLDTFDDNLRLKQTNGTLDTVDYALLEKTLVRKGLALEKADKFRKARKVYNEVRQRFPRNMQASQGIHRCDDYLGDKEIDFSPVSNWISPVSQNSSPLLEKTVPVEKPVKDEKSFKIEEVKQTESTPKNDAGVTLSLEHFEKQKEEGNTAFKKSNFPKAYEIFTKIVNSITLNYPDIDNDKNDKLCILLVSVLSNRAFTCAKINKFYQGIEDCNRIIKIDADNAKAYYRRYICEEEIAAELRNERKKYREQSLIIDMLKKEKSFIENCISDLGVVMKHAKESQYKLKIDELKGILSALDEELKKLCPEDKSAGVEVLGSTETPHHKSDDKKETPARTPITPSKPQVNPSDNLNMDEITIQALDKIISNSSVPNNASKFEVELKSFKTHYAKMWQYLKKFDSLDFLAQLYKSREMESSVSKQLIGCLSDVFGNE